MRTRPIKTFDPSTIVILFLALFVFQLATILYMGEIYPATRLSDDLFTTEIDPRRFVVSLPGYVVRADRCSPSEIERYSPIYSEELSRYSQAILRKIPLARIVLCSRLTLNGREFGGLTLASEGTVFLNVGRSLQEHEDVARRAIHHELFHIIDVVISSTPDIARAWTAMNPRDFVYSGNALLEALDVTNESSEGRSEFPGLLNHYSMVSLQEDRAVLFSYMMVSPEALSMIAAGDEILAQKIDHLKRELRAFSGDFAAILGSP